MPPRPRVLSVMVDVIPEVTPLAHGLQVLRANVRNIVIQVGDGQDDPTLRPLRRLAVQLLAAPPVMESALALALAAVAGAVRADVEAQGLPSGRVLRVVDGGQ